jgi:endonuclease G
MKRFTQALAAICLLALALSALPLIARQSSDTTKGVNPNVRFGMPKETKADADNRDEFLVKRQQYVLSYSDTKRTPNWVSWRLVIKDLGRTERGPFKHDPALPKAFAVVKSSEYSGSGFDRGHMCPSGDRSEGAGNDETFMMSNVVPQAPNCNQKAWERLESYCRALAKAGNELHVACGPFGKGGFGKGGFANTVGPAKVQVPSRVWKVVLVLPKGAEPTDRTRTIAVIMPNNQTVDTNWAQWRVSVSDVETLTGYKFWPDLKADVADAIKAVADDSRIGAPDGELLKKKKKTDKRKNKKGED